MFHRERSAEISPGRDEAEVFGEEDESDASDVRFNLTTATLS